MLSKLCQRLVLTVLLCVMAFMPCVVKAGEMRIVYPANGLYSIQPKCAPNLELTVQDASTKDGANVFLWSINSNWHTQLSHQKWRITRIGSGQWYKIEAEKNYKMAEEIYLKEKLPNKAEEMRRQYREVNDDDMEALKLQMQLRDKIKLRTGENK